MLIDCRISNIFQKSRNEFSKATWFKHIASKNNNNKKDHFEASLIFQYANKACVVIKSSQGSELERMEGMEKNKPT